MSDKLIYSEFAGFFICWWYYYSRYISPKRGSFVGYYRDSQKTG